MSSNTETNAGSKYLRDTSLKQEAKDAVQRAANEVGEPLSYADYDSWQQQDGDAPGSTTVTRRLGDGKWIETCRRAGVECWEDASDDSNKKP